MEENKEIETITNEEQPVQEQSTVQSVEPNNNDNKKENNKKLITIILIIAASLALIFAVLFFVVFNHDDKDDEDYADEPEVVENEDEDKKETTENETKQEENKQNEVCEKKEKDKSDEVEKILGKANLGSTGYSRVLYNTEKYDYSQISDGAKFQTAIWSYDGQKQEKKICYDTEQKSCEMLPVYDFNEFKNNYKDIFGIDYNLNVNGMSDVKFTEIEKKQFIAGACPFVYKIDGNDLYISHNCGGTSGNGVYADYVYDYNKSDSKVEVYVAVAYWAYGSSQSTETIYKDYEFKNAYKTDVTFKDCIKIDKNNYNEFSKFKVIYEKNSSGKYIFKSSERISSGK